MEALGSRPTYDDRVEEDTREIEARELFPEMRDSGVERFCSERQSAS
jgi:hypothetical protein